MLSLHRPNRPNRPNRRLALFAALMTLAGSALAQTFPTKPLSLIVPYPAGGISDNLARIVERPLNKLLGQPVLVDNIGGVGGAIAAQRVLSAPADGHTLYQGSPNELILSPLALKVVKYNAEDWRLVQVIGNFPLAVIARKGLPANNIDELVALARKADAEGKPLSYASVGIGSLYHLLGAHFGEVIGARLNHVPYRGGAPVMQDLGGELVDVAFIVVGDQTVGLAAMGRLKFLATLAPAGVVEAPFLKGIPSINESKAVRNFAFNTWTGYFVPKDTPEPVVQSLKRSLAAVMSDAESKTQIEKIGGTAPAAMSLDDSAKFYASQTTRFRTIAKSIKLEAQ